MVQMTLHVLEHTAPRHAHHTTSVAWPTILRHVRGLSGRGTATALRHPRVCIGGGEADDDDALCHSIRLDDTAAQLQLHSASLCTGALTYRSIPTFRTCFDETLKRMVGVQQYVRRRYSLEYTSKSPGMWINAAWRHWPHWEWESMGLGESTLPQHQIAKPGAGGCVSIDEVRQNLTTAREYASAQPTDHHGHKSGAVQVLPILCWQVQPHQPNPRIIGALGM